MNFLNSMNTILKKLMEMRIIFKKCAFQNFFASKMLPQMNIPQKVVPFFSYIFELSSYVKAIYTIST